MALVDTTWYCNSVGYSAVTAWATGATIAAGALRRQNTTPAVGSERVFVCIVAGTTHATTEPTWVLTRGAKTTDNTVTWMECTGQAALNGDLANTATWAQVKAATPAVLGQIIKRSNNASFQICTTAGAMSASEPAFSDTAGVTTTDTTAVWTSLGVVGNFTGGQAPFARLASACASTWFAAGNTVYVGDNHAESQTTAITITPALSGATVGRIICHNHSGSYPPTSSDLASTATISTTAAANITFNPVTGGIYVYGLTFQAGVGASTAATSLIFTPSSAFYNFSNCSFKIAGTAISQIVQLNTTLSGNVIWSNCTISFAAVSQSIDVGTTFFTWQNTGPILVSGSVVPTSLLGQSASGRLANVTLEGLDLSQVTGNLISPSFLQMGNLLVKDCKLNVSLSVLTPVEYGHTVQFVRSDSSGTAYKSTRYQYEGTETTETSITRVGGSVDPSGQAQTRKIVTTANAQWLRPFQAEPYAIWNTVTGATVTVTVYGTINAGAVPNNDDIWIEVEYLGSSATPIGTIVTTTKATLLNTGTAVASDNSVWNGGGSGAGWSPFKLAVTITPAMAGVIEARIRAAKAATTFYIDPQPVLT